MRTVSKNKSINSLKLCVSLRYGASREKFSNTKAKRIKNIKSNILFAPNFDGTLVKNIGAIKASANILLWPIANTSKGSPGIETCAFGTAKNNKIKSAAGLGSSFAAR